MDEIYGLPDPKPKGPQAMTHTWVSQQTHGERYGQRCFIEVRVKEKLFIRFEDGGWVWGTGGNLRKLTIT